MRICSVICFLAAASALTAGAKDVAYLYGDVAADGTVPSSPPAPFHQMLLSDTGNLGCSEFRDLVLAQGYTITSYYDQSTTLNASFLGGFDVVVFGLHQKVWSAAERAALDGWMRAGGGILMYSDSAAGGLHSTVGIENPVGQTAVNSILTDYGMQVAVDQGGGVRSYTSETGERNPMVADQPVFEGEGVSPVAVDESSGARVLIPFEEATKISGGTLTIDARNVTIPAPRWAALAHRQVGDGNVVVIFDRQPVWNNGPGSNITKRDNREMLRRIVRYLARDYANSEEWFDASADMEVNPADGKAYLEYSYRQWSGGAGNLGVDYLANGSMFTVEHSPTLAPMSWSSGTAVAEQVGPRMDLGDGTEQVKVRVLPGSEDFSRGFVRLNLSASVPIPLVVEAGRNTFIGEGGAAVISGTVTGEGVVSSIWSHVSGPGTTTFANAASPSTTATFSVPGSHELRLAADNGSTQASDTVFVTVADSNDVVRAINCGGSGYTGNNGFVYEADTLFSGGHIDGFPGNAVAETEDDLLYNYARSAHSSYSIPMANGNYFVFLQFAETFFTGTNQRVFDTTIEGSLVIDDLDLVATAPGKWVAYDVIVPVTVSGGPLDIGFSASQNNALLNALVVIGR